MPQNVEIFVQEMKWSFWHVEDFDQFEMLYVVMNFCSGGSGSGGGSCEAAPASGAGPRASIPKSGRSVINKITHTLESQIESVHNCWLTICVQQSFAVAKQNTHAKTKRKLYNCNIKQVYIRILSNTAEEYSSLFKYFMISSWSSNA